MKRPPNPNHGGSYRVVNGQLVEESAALVTAPIERLGGRGITVPPIDAPNTPASTPRPARKVRPARGGRHES